MTTTTNAENGVENTTESTQESTANNNGSSSPLLSAEVKEVQTLDDFLGEDIGAVEEVDVPLSDFIEAEDIEIDESFGKEGGEGDEIPEDVIEEEDEGMGMSDDMQEPSHGKHSLKLGGAIEFAMTALKELTWRRVRIRETDYYRLEVDKELDSTLRAAFRKAGLYEQARSHNLRMKDLIGLTDQELREGKELADVLFDKYAVNVEMGPEGKMAFLLAGAIYRNYTVITDEITKANALTKAQLDDSVREVKQYFEEFKKREAEKKGALGLGEGKK